jgi:hypothetical protein
LKKHKKKREPKDARERSQLNEVDIFDLAVTQEAPGKTSEEIG